MSDESPVRKSAPERFWSKADPPDGNGCRLWTGSITPKGYGRFKMNGVCQQAHRVAFVLSGRTIPEGMQLDHLCRNRRCVNPDHLEPVTSRENTIRGETIPAANAAKTHCVNGHPLTPDNLYPSNLQRVCRTCKNTRNRERMRRIRGTKPEGYRV